MRHCLALIVVLGWCSCANDLLSRSLAARIVHIDPARRAW